MFSTVSAIKLTLDMKLGLIGAILVISVIAFEVHTSVLNNCLSLLVVGLVGAVHQAQLERGQNELEPKVHILFVC